MWSDVTEEVPKDKIKISFFFSSLRSKELFEKYFVITTGRCVVAHIQMKFVIFISLRGYYIIRWKSDFLVQCSIMANHLSKSHVCMNPMYELSLLYFCNKTK